MVVRECCKAHNQSQWRRANFDPPPLLNPLTNHHQIWIRDYVRDIYHPGKFYLDRIRGFASVHARLRAPLFTRLSFFLGSNNHLQPRRHHRHQRKIYQQTRFCTRMCLLGVAIPKFNIYTHFSPLKPPFWGPIKTVLRNYRLKNSLNIRGTKSKRPLDAIIAP